MVHAYRDATLLAALAASIAIHASVLVALGGIERRPQAANALPQPEPRVLAVALITPNAPILSTPEPAPVETTAPPLPVLPAEPPAIVPAATEAVAAVAAGVHDRVGLNKSHIDVSDQVPRARFGDALDRDALADFPVEVDRAIVLPDRRGRSSTRRATSRKRVSSRAPTSSRTRRNQRSPRPSSFPHTTRVTTSGSTWRSSSCSGSMPATTEPPRRAPPRRSADARRR
jgi:hypothetical protein